MNRNSNRGFIRSIFTFIKLFIALLILGTLVITALLVAKPNVIRQFVRARIQITPARGSVDLNQISRDEVKGKVQLQVFNSLPLGITLENMTYGVLLNDLEIASGCQFAPKAQITAMATSTLEVAFAVSPEKVKSALSELKVEQAAQLGQALLNRLKGKKKFSNQASEGPLRIIGSANFRILMSSWEVPVDKGTTFDKTF